MKKKEEELNKENSENAKKNEKIKEEKKEEKEEEKEQKQNETNQEEKEEVEVKEVKTSQKEKEEKTDTNESRIENAREQLIEKKKKKIIIIVSLIVALVIAFFISTGFALFNINNSNIMPNITINGVEIEKLSKEEALQKLNEKYTAKTNGTILIKAPDFEYEMQLAQIETKYNIEKALEEAYKVGRSSNIFVNNFEIATAIFFGKDIKLEYTYNEELLNDKLNDIASKVPNAVVEPSYYIEEEKLIINKGIAGNSINKEQTKQEIVNTILNNNENQEINIELIKQEPKAIDIDAIYKEVYTEPKDAYYTQDPFQIFEHVNGVDFDLEKAKEILKEDKEEYEIPLVITVPDVTINEIGTEAFPDLLSSFSTRYDASKTDRTTNLKLAMKKLDGVVVAPGETFSYNKTLGKRTAEAGYKEAGGYAGGKVVQTLAGGICQISSTLYDAVVYANLEIVERHNHMFLAGYVGAGKDATVVYGALDFKFKNTRKYPIMIKTSIGSGVAKIDIYGVKEDVEYDVDIVTKILSYTPYKVIYEKDSSMQEGKEKVVQSAMNGCKSITYKVLKLNGTEVSRTVLSSDTYDPMNKIIKVGTKKKTTSSTNNKKEETSNKKEETNKTESKPSNTNTKPNNTAQNTTNTTTNNTIKNET